MARGSAGPRAEQPGRVSAVVSRPACPTERGGVLQPAALPAVAVRPKSPGGCIARNARQIVAVLAGSEQRSELAPGPDLAGKTLETRLHFCILRKDCARLRLHKGDPKTAPRASVAYGRVTEIRRSRFTRFQAQILAVIVDIFERLEPLAVAPGRDLVLAGLKGPQADDQLVAAMGDGVVGDRDIEVN